MFRDARLRPMSRLIWAMMAVGCSMQPPRISVPSMDPDGAGSAAIAAYDKNGDSAISDDELQAVPGLRAGMGLIDQNRDGRLTADEISKRISDYQSSRIGLSSVQVNVMLDGRPLSGADVHLIPEEFLGTSIEAASGVTDQHGTMNPRIESIDATGLRSGVYRITVSKKAADGSESLPAKFNPATTLGTEIGPRSSAVANGSVELNLKSK